MLAPVLLRARRDLAGLPTVHRCDRIRLDFAQAPVPPVKLDSGHVVLWGVATRVGIFDYDDEQVPGKVFRELRPPEEVLDAASLETLRGVPFTLDHPTEDVTIDNTRELSHGTVLSVRTDGDLVWVEIRATSKDALSIIDRGTVELSCGYDALLDDSPGVWLGHRYDAVQRKIRYNHLALVDAARAGPVARLKLDSLRVLRRDQRKRPKMKFTKFIHDGKTLSLPVWCVPGLVDGSQTPRKDAIEVAKVSIEVDGEMVELVLPKATVESMLAVAGAAGEVPPAEPEMPAADPMGGDADPMATEEEEDKAKLAPRGRFDAKAVEKIVDARIAKALERKDAESRQRSAVERRAVSILDAGYPYATTKDVWQICADVVTAVESSRKDEAARLLAEARKGDALSQGRLLTRFEDACDKRRDAEDSTDEQLRSVVNADGRKAEPEMGPAEAAEKRYLDKLHGRKTEAATA